MRQEILDYLKTQRVGVLAVEMMDGSPHASTVHFAHSEDPFVFYFETNKEYRKSEVLFGKEVTRASFVIGTTETDMKTFQIDGIAELVKYNEREMFDTFYFAKFPEKLAKVSAPGHSFVFFKFTPTWWRFTDWKSSTGKLVLTSDEK